MLVWCEQSVFCGACATGTENRRPFFDPGEYFGVRVTEGALVGMLSLQNV